MKKVAVIGHFAYGMEYLDGQTIKTKIVTEELQKPLGDEQVGKTDTHGGIKTLFKAPFHAFNALKNSKNVIIFPAHNSLRVYAPLLSVLKPFFPNRKLHYVVIGGWLPQFLLNREWLVKFLKSFDGIYVETMTMKAALEAQRFSNVYVMPNCKNLAELAEKDLVYPSGMPYKLCTFSRVSREKGIEDAVRAVEAANTELGHQAFSLDIYGQIDPGQTEWFESLQKTFPKYIRYGGCIPYNKSAEVLKEYFALLFPTYYEGEGFAGTLIDAYAAGVPVVASDWKYNTELINRHTGYTYPTGNQTAFVSLLKEIASDSTMILNKKVQCLQEIEKYRTENVVRILIKQLDDT